MGFLEQETSPLACQLRRTITIVDEVMSNLSVLQDGSKDSRNLNRVLKSLKDARRFVFSTVPTLMIIEPPAEMEEEIAADNFPRQTLYGRVINVQENSLAVSVKLEDLELEDVRFVLGKRAKNFEQLKPRLVLWTRSLPQAVEQLLLEEAAYPTLGDLEFIDALGFEPALVADWFIKDNLIVPAFARERRAVYIRQFWKLYHLWKKGSHFHDAWLHQIFEYAALATTIKIKA
ncbi:MAG: hypothetical protein HYW45_03195 [Candidatus Daviesbacteria bacterium]|nr:MAG: hypothetical protein HYW45_03195 [Candidatus Daviesbacteria bacterium]